MKKNKEKILIIRLSSMGDVVLSTVVFPNIKAEKPDAHLSVLVKEEFADIFKNNPHIDEIIPFCKNEKLFSKVREIRQKRFDIVIDLHKNMRSTIISLFSAAKKKITYSKGIFARRCLIYTKKNKHPIIHTIERYLNTLSRLGIEISCNEPQIFLSEEELAQIKNRLKNTKGNIAQNLIGINLGAKHETKRWVPGKYRKLIQELLAKNYTPILFGSKNDLQFTKKIIGDFKTPYAVNKIFTLVGKTNIRELACLISLCDILITPDSGSMHIASALKVPVIALFGPTTLDFGFGPWGENNIVIQKDLPCRPCSIHGGKNCRIKTLDCMNKIAVEDVIEAIENIAKIKQ